MTPPTLNYASPNPVRRRRLRLSGPFVILQFLNLYIGICLWLWVMHDDMGMFRIISSPVAGLIGVAQFFTFTRRGWSTFLQPSTLSPWAKVIGVMGTTMGTALSLAACYFGIATAHGGC